jgi:lysophospholipase L1-like esterase
MSLRGVTACGLVALALTVASARDAPPDARRHWVGTWTASPAAPDGLGIAVSDRTIRQTVHTSIGGRRMRVRLANTFGTVPLRIEAVAVALVADGAPIASTGRSVTFGGAPAITIPQGARVVSDPIRLHVPADGDVVVSFYVAGTTEPLTFHRFASATTYVSVPGDHVADPTMDSFWFPMTSFFVLDGVDVSAPRHVHAVVALGDSITDGVGSTVDANRRYPDFLARRLRARGRRTAILDAGIGGNRILTDTGAAGVNALARFDRDVLAQAGVSTVVVLEGINDIGFSDVPLDQCSICTEVSAQAMAAGYEQLIAQAHRHGLRILGGTLLPFAGAFDYSAGEAKRQAVNDWIRHRSSFDGVIDFDAVMAARASAPSASRIRQRRSPASRRCGVRGDGGGHRSPLSPPDAIVDSTPRRADGLHAQGTTAGRRAARAARRQLRLSRFRRIRFSMRKPVRMLCQRLEECFDSPPRRR